MVFPEAANSGIYSLLATNGTVNFPQTPSANINITQIAYNGSTGPTGSQSTVTGPTGPQSTVTGPTGPTGPTVEIMNTFTPTYASNTLTANFSTGVFATGSLASFTGNITNYSFTGGVTNGEYLIIIPASGGDVTINPLSSGQTTYYFNFSPSVTVTSTHYGIMRVNYDGTRYYISCSAYIYN